MTHVLQQPRRAKAWVMGRANVYHQRGVKAHDCDRRACVPLLLMFNNPFTRPFRLTSVTRSNETGSLT